MDDGGISVSELVEELVGKIFELEEVADERQGSWERELNRHLHVRSEDGHLLRLVR